MSLVKRAGFCASAASTSGERSSIGREKAASSTSATRYMPQAIAPSA